MTSLSESTGPAPSSLWSVPSRVRSHLASPRRSGFGPFARSSALVSPRTTGAGACLLPPSKTRCAPRPFIHSSRPQVFPEHGMWRCPQAEPWGPSGQLITVWICRTRLALPTLPPRGGGLPTTTAGERSPFPLESHGSCCTPPCPHTPVPAERSPPSRSPSFFSLLCAHVRLCTACLPSELCLMRWLFGRRCSRCSM